MATVESKLKHIKTSKKVGLSYIRSTHFTSFTILDVHVATHQFLALLYLPYFCTREVLLLVQQLHLTVI